MEYSKYSIDCFEVVSEIGRNPTKHHNYADVDSPQKCPTQDVSLRGLGFLASAVEAPKKLHPNTKLCKSFDEVKVFVEADLYK